MKYGKVIGTYVSNRQSSGIKQGKLLLVQPREFDKTPSGQPFVAIDSVGSGAGEYIIYVGGMEATFPFDNKMLPVDACIVGIVDRVDLYDLCYQCGKVSCIRSVDPNATCCMTKAVGK